MKYRKLSSSALLLMLSISMLTLAFNIETARASSTITILVDGTVDPATAPILIDGDLYIFTDDIFDTEIVVQKDDIVIDGAGYTLEGTGSGTGIDLFEIDGVTIKNMNIKSFGYGIHLQQNSDENTISENNITDNSNGVFLWDCHYNTIYRNNITNNYNGIQLIGDCNYNTIERNHITKNIENGIYVEGDQWENILKFNNIVENGFGIFSWYDSYYWSVFSNNFIDNGIQVWMGGESDTVWWDNGYPNGGNYWSDYSGVDIYSGPGQNSPNGDGIGDTPYSIDIDTEDHYPLMEPWFLIRIEADGRVDPVDAPIVQIGGTYTLANNINHPIIVEKDNVIVDGAGHKIVGRIYYSAGVGLAQVEGVTVRNLVIQGFPSGILIMGGGDHLVQSNYITNNQNGIFLYLSDGSYITHNVIAGNEGGIGFFDSISNTIALNLIINNDIQIGGFPTGNQWTDEGSGYGNFWSNYWGEDTNGDGIGDTGTLPHEGVDDNPIVDPSIPMQFGELPFGPDWWIGPAYTVWRGGWSPVDIQVTDAMGRVISASENEIGLNAFYAEEWQGDTKLVMILIVVPTPLDGYEGVYDFQMTAGADLTYWLRTLVSYGNSEDGIGGEVLYSQSVEDVFLGNGETKNVGVVLTQNEDGSVTVTSASDDPETRLLELIETVEGMGLPEGIENSLTVKLENAIKSLEKGKQNTAINQLNAFINQAEALKGKKLTNEQADLLITEAQRIIDLI